MTTLGLISDTHGRLVSGVFDAFAHVDYIIHAGDIGDPFLLDELQAIAPVFACLGNNDWRDFGPSVQNVVTTYLGGVHILVTHYPQDANAYAKRGEHGLVVHGHSHIPRDVVIGTCRVVNPGSASQPRGTSTKSVMTLDVADGIVGPSRLITL